jgi:type I restriction enzyme S subunit
MANVTTKSSLKKSPKLRFPGYTADWEEKRLGEVTTLFSRRNKKLVDAKVYSVTNTDGFVLQSKRFDKVIAGDNLTGYKIIEKNDFAYNPARVNVGSIAHFKDDIGIISSLYVCFKTNEGISDDFLSYFLQLDRTKHDINVYGEGGVRIYLWYPLFAQIKIRIPAESEQEKIANFLTSVDSWIDSLRAQKANLESYKKGMMQRLFTQEIRFKDATEKSFPRWENKTFADVALFQKGRGISKEDIVQNGKHKCIRYGELYTEYGEVIMEVKSRTNVAIEDSFLSKKNDILMPSSGETALDIASVSCVNEDNVLLGGDLTVIRPNKDQSGAFLSYYLSNYQKRNIARLAQGNSVVHLYASHLKKLELKLPCFAEQKKIAEFLTSIDSLIEAKKHQVSQAKEWKKGLMQQLFI